MKSTTSYLFFVLLFPIIYSCNTERPSLPASSGKTGEILVIVNKSYWDSAVGDSIKHTLTSEFLGLGQSEPMFSLANIEERAFAKIFEGHRNIFIADIKPENEGTKFEVRKNVWAQPQVVIKIAVNSKERFYELLSKHKNQIVRLFLENERERMMRAFKREQDINITNTLIEKYGLSLVVPKGYFIAEQTTDFCWIRRETEETSIGLLLYFMDYTDTIVFEHENIILMRDSVTKIHIPGPREGSYMQVSQKVVLPFSKRISFNGNFAVETRGLWDVKGDFMGGPFINYVLIDEKRNKVVNLDAFIYAPRFNKRDYIFQAEALIYSLEFH